MKKKNCPEKNCAHCEHAKEIFQGEYCICQKKGVVLPEDHCSAFIFDPLKIKVSIRKIPEFHRIEPDWNKTDEKNS